jgi:hypothetical protein
MLHEARLLLENALGLPCGVCRDGGDCRGLTVNCVAAKDNGFATGL